MTNRTRTRRRTGVGTQTFRDVAIIVVLVLLATSVRFTGDDTATVAGTPDTASRAVGGLQAAVLPPGDVGNGDPVTAASSGCPLERAESKCEKPKRIDREVKVVVVDDQGRQKAFELKLNPLNLETVGKLFRIGGDHGCDGLETTDDGTAVKTGTKLHAQRDKTDDKACVS